MQFVKDGPEVPERLLQAHEEGRVVFFCGAGISYPAGLPGFGGLVAKLYDELGTTPTPIEDVALESKQYDTAIGLLESRVVGNRFGIRTAIAKILTPKKRVKNATATHEALLTLSRNGDGRIRLITTNFDRLFVKEIERQKLHIPHFCAPLLPVPKKRWDGLVYLHGLLPAKATAGELDRLIVSSGDFGLAYLTERWAARFVSELFRSYTVCFVGYSIDDPVLRYMMDALAADRLLGENPPEAYAFGSYMVGNDTEADSRWRAKNVTPILYHEEDGHRLLHATLKAWAETHRDGVRGQEAIISRYAATRPLGSTKQDNFIGRMIWALSDPSGLPAKKFADFDPPPHIDWLEAFSLNRFNQHDLPRFRVLAESEVDDKFSFSLTNRPSPYSLAPWMCLVSPAFARRGGLDKVMAHLARWLVRHLDDPRLLLWVAATGSKLHDNLAYMIVEALGENPPSALTPFWQIVLSGRLKDSSIHLDLFSWRKRLANEGLTSSLRRQLRDNLSPRIQLRKAYHYEEDDDGEIGDEIPQIDWELVLEADHVHSLFKDIAKGDAWQNALPLLLNDATDLLIETMELMQELGKANEDRDGSCWQQPSIKPHPQNRTYRDWTALIDLARDAWLATADQTPARAVREVCRWSELRFPLFQRLVFFAAAERSELFSVDETLTWLLARDHYWLWSVETQHEVMELISVLATRMNKKQCARLEAALLKGPSATDADTERQMRRTNREVWRRLFLLKNSGANLSKQGDDRINSILSTNPEWSEPGEKDAFPIWISNGDIGREYQSAPVLRRDLEQWLLNNPDTDDFDNADDWRDRCRNDYPRCAVALVSLASRGHWLIGRWRQALQVWSEEQPSAKSWRHLSVQVVGAPVEVIDSLLYSIAWWLKACAKHVSKDDSIFFILVQRVLRSAALESSDQSIDTISAAINHPVGYVTEACLTWWYKQGLEDGQRLRGEILLAFSLLTDPMVAAFRHGRLLLCAHVITLFRVDPEWTTLHILPLFDWADETQARAAWSGLLWSPRLYWPLLRAIKTPFLATASHYAALDDLKQQYVGLLTYAALEGNGVITQKEFATTFLTLPADALENAVLNIADAIESAADKREEYWENRAKPYFQKIWPKSQELRTPNMAANFGRLIVGCGEAFPDALAVLNGWLQPTDHTDIAIHKLNESGLCERFPDEALTFLSLVFCAQPRWSARDMRACLNTIMACKPALTADLKYVRLDTALREAGH